MTTNEPHYIAFAVQRGGPGRRRALVRAGHAHVHENGDLVISLDLIPLNGQLQLLHLPLHWHRIWNRPEALA